MIPISAPCWPQMTSHFAVFVCADSLTLKWSISDNSHFQEERLAHGSFPAVRLIGVPHEACGWWRDFVSVSLLWPVWGLTGMHCPLSCKLNPRQCYPQSIPMKQNAVKSNGTEGSEISALHEKRTRHNIRVPIQSVQWYKEQWNKGGIVRVPQSARVHC